MTRVAAGEALKVAGIALVRGQNRHAICTVSSLGRCVDRVVLPSDGRHAEPTPNGHNPVTMLLDAEQLPTITTPRLRLRWLTTADVPALLAIFGDPVVCRYWSREALPDMAAAASLHQEISHCFAERSLFQWGIADRTTDAVIGTCTLASLSVQHRRAELGFALARSAWGRGYVAEALAALLDFAFETLQLHRLEADVDPRNARSILVLEKLGFKREGYLRERYHLGGEVQDALLYGLLKREWRK